MRNQYRPKSWIDPRLAVRRSPSDRKGMFAKAPIGNGVTLVTCRCCSPDCHGQVTGDDWELPELQKRCAGHFSPFLNRRLAGKREQRIS